MSTSDATDRLTRKELAWELVEVFDGLSIERINEMLAKNVPMETLEFFSTYARNFSEKHSVEGKPRELMPNLLLLGYLLRILEEQLINEVETFDA